ncbi:hypothetical protein KIN20_032058 [Parelaphostrongylus tenuis]|uniref:Uncharacterized protein n=1 Tax=Parelaphostrongylus tenuis TaxID=148309 RepID=A0AAD5R6D7_PARTN|nr:hypothetical protein KIN20_032058 [Parelaphostrongylus tenuis]
MSVCREDNEQTRALLQVVDQLLQGVRVETFRAERGVIRSERGASSNALIVVITSCVCATATVAVVFAACSVSAGAVDERRTRERRAVHRPSVRQAGGRPSVYPSYVRLLSVGRSERSGGSGVWCGGCGRRSERGDVPPRARANRRHHVPSPRSYRISPYRLLSVRSRTSCRSSFYFLGKSAFKLVDWCDSP